MNECINCQNETICTGNKRKGSHANCFVPKNYPSYLDSPKPTRKQTNYDRIKNMSVEEMANFIADIYADNEHAEIRVNGEWLTAEDMEQWLKSEVSDE